jgi:hypothetical protein
MPLLRLRRRVGLLPLQESRLLHPFIKPALHVVPQPELDREEHEGVPRVQERGLLRRLWEREGQMPKQKVQDGILLPVPPAVVDQRLDLRQSALHLQQDLLERRGHQGVRFVRQQRVRCRQGASAHPSAVPRMQDIDRAHRWLQAYEVLELQHELLLCVPVDLQWRLEVRVLQRVLWEGGRKTKTDMNY